MLLELGLLFGTYGTLRGYENSKKRKAKRKKRPLILKKDLKKSKPIELIKAEEKNSSKKQNILTTTDGKHFKVSILSVGFSIAGRFSFVAHMLNTATIIYTMIPIFRRTEKRVLKDKKISHEVLIATINSLALYSNQFIGISFAMFAYHLGAKIISKTRDTSQKNITNLFQNEPKKVWVLKDSIEIEIELEKVLIDDIVVVETGEVIPVDGKVIDGIAMVDQHSLTGESEPKEREIEDIVFASTVVVSGKLYVKVQKRGSETTISQITNVLEKTVNLKSYSQLSGEKWADRSALFLLSLGAVSFPFLGAVGTTALLNSGFGSKVHVLAPLSVLNHLNLAYQSGILEPISKVQSCEKIEQNL